MGRKTQPETWSGARARWADADGLGPWQRLAAMVAAGQLMRIGWTASGVPALAQGLLRAPEAPPPPSLRVAPRGNTLLFFQTVEQGDAEPTLLPTAALLALHKTLQATAQGQ